MLFRRTGRWIALLSYATGVEFCLLLFRMLDLTNDVIGWSRYVTATIRKSGAEIK